MFVCLLALLCSALLHFALLCCACFLACLLACLHACLLPVGPPRVSHLLRALAEQARAIHHWRNFTALSRPLSATRPTPLPSAARAEGDFQLHIHTFTSPTIVDFTGSRRQEPQRRVRGGQGIAGALQPDLARGARPSARQVSHSDHY